MERKTAMEMKGRDGMRTERREEKKLLDPMVGSIHIATPQASRSQSRGSSHQGREAARHQGHDAATS
jgi:hypothetical protein